MIGRLIIPNNGTHQNRRIINIVNTTTNNNKIQEYVKTNINENERQKRRGGGRSPKDS